MDVRKFPASSQEHLDESEPLSQEQIIALIEIIAADARRSRTLDPNAIVQALEAAAHTIKYYR